MTSIIDIYRQFLRKDISLEQFRDWLALYQWDLPESEQYFADVADVALVHLDDEYIDEGELRFRLASVLEENTTKMGSFKVLLNTTASLWPPYKSHNLGTASDNTTTELIGVV